ncbi:malto-oligosyltrehalose synthase [Microbacterium radiodurans]|uniref:Malto-oligosyltrehalose synthase n=1 Tax=Microbacterium radiodurans TaxID=661398 RepID=A0A5J5ITZ1_9MICO|nr:malto-oligosyltrehalose synthase [Microbacterium radiodurans]KAA9089039.1 malto-oligosyltrehalose synthase [Microbacterium radiodurans]
MTVPVSTYRLQIRPAFDLAEAAGTVDYLRELGVDWAYLSPILAAAEGSDHGYDVIDPTQVDPRRGGPDGLARFAAAARDAGLGILVDIVPNHQGVAVPAENPWWWDVLRHGRDSVHADAFDIDWEHGGGKIALPILGSSLREAIANGEIEVSPVAAGDPDDAAHGAAGVARYYDHVLPLADGTAPAAATSDPATVDAVLAAQHWRPGFWRDDADELNFRRFFAVTTLAGVRVELPEVFDASHAEILRWLREGLADGLRIDHPDGLADPGGYLARLAEATGGAYVVVEKILEHAATDHAEELPAWWATAGTTGYDAMAEIDRVLIDPAGEEALDALDADLADAAPTAYADIVREAKRAVADTIQAAEVGRLVRGLPADVREPLGEEVARDALAQLLTAFSVYRVYPPVGAEIVADAVAAATTDRPDLADALATLAPLVAEPGTELARRFAQTTGPVMAKGVEDSAFYRYPRIGTLTEVGGDPSVFSLDVAGFHRAQASRLAAWPHALTALSTHDTKRSEDVRARLSVIAEVPGRWRETLERLRSIASTGDGRLDDLLWQAIVGAWPASPERLQAYAEKASREGGIVTSWTEPDADAEARVGALVDAATGDARVVVEDFVSKITAAGRSNSLAAKLLQLAGPGVPDVYQGTELWDHSLVDPDNRRDVDFAERRDLLARLDDGWQPPIDDTGAAKLLVVSRALRARRDRPELYTRYAPLPVVGAAADHGIAFDRGGAIAVATRLPVGLSARGGWGDTVVVVPPGIHRDELTGRTWPGGEVRLADLLDTYPVALLTRAESTASPAASPATEENA